MNQAPDSDRTLVFSQLASDILHRIRVDAGLEEEPEPEIEPKTLSTVSLDYEDYDEDYFCREKRVADYNDFANILKENKSTPAKRSLYLKRQGISSVRR